MLILDDLKTYSNQNKNHNQILENETDDIFHILIF